MKKLITALLIALCFTTPVQASGYNPYVGGYRNCTWTVWQCVHDYLGYDLPGWHNAGQWAYDAAQDGYLVSDTPAVNSIIVWSNHVAFITDMTWDEYGNTLLHIIEGGASIGYQETWVVANAPRGPQQFIGYIYVMNPDIAMENGANESNWEDTLDNAWNYYVTPSQASEIQEQKKIRAEKPKVVTNAYQKSPFLGEVSSD